MEGAGDLFGNHHFKIGPLPIRGDIGHSHIWDCPYDASIFTDKAKMDLVSRFPAYRNGSLIGLRESETGG